jgi:hypothetical protein
MMEKILTPRVEYCEESDLRAEVLGIGRDMQAASRWLLETECCRRTPCFEVQ